MKTNIHGVPMNDNNKLAGMLFYYIYEPPFEDGFMEKKIAEITDWLNNGSIGDDETLADIAQEWKWNDNIPDVMDADFVASDNDITTLVEMWFYEYGASRTTAYPNPFYMTEEAPCFVRNNESNEWHNAYTDEANEVEQKWLKAHNES